MANTLSLQSLYRVIAFFRELQSDFPAGAMHCLITVMLDEGITQNEVAAKIGMAGSSCSRNMRLLSDRLSPGKEGMGLIELRTDRADIRFKGAYLTPKGVALRDQLLEVLNK